MFMELSRTLTAATRLAVDFLVWFRALRTVERCFHNHSNKEDTMKIKIQPMRATLLAVMLGAATTAGAQQYVDPDSPEFVLQQILDQVVGARYGTHQTYRTPQQQELFRRADTNRDGILTRQEINAYRSRMGYAQYYDRNGRPIRSNDRGVNVRVVDTNRDGYISRREASEFVRDVQREGLDRYFERRERDSRYR